MALAADIAQIVAQTSEILGIDDPATDEALEACAAYFALQHAGLEAGTAAASVAQVKTGGSNDSRLDGIAAVLDGEVLTPDLSAADLTRRIEAADQPVVSFVFVQATGADPAKPNAPKLSDKINGFLTGLNVFFFSDANNRAMNKRLLAWLSFRDRLFAVFDAMELRAAVRVHAYLVWPRERILHETHRNDIEAQGRGLASALRERILGEPAFTFMDDAAFVGFHEDLRRRGAFRISASTVLAVPETGDGVQMYTGYVPAPLFFEQVSDRKNGKTEIRSALFYDNVRHYLGDDDRMSGVNPEIIATLEDPAERPRFHLKSNGVAVIADRMSRDGEAFLFENVQIVNGCQTSHALFRTMRKLPEADWTQVFVPARFIVSPSGETTDNMIVALNLQSRVDELQIFSRRPYVIRLEAYFRARAAEPEAPPLLFERRAGQYSDVKDRSRVLTLRDVMSSYAACFGGAPHAAFRLDGLVAGVHRGAIFGAQNREFYFLAAALRQRARRNGLAVDREETNAMVAQHLHATRRLLERRARLSTPGPRIGKAADDYLNGFKTVALNTAVVDQAVGRAKRLVNRALAEVGGGSRSERAATKPLTTALDALIDAERA